MSFALNNVQQISLEDRINNLTERELKFLKKSWAESFSNTIFPNIDEKKFSVLFCADNGRPNAPINVIIGSLMIKELFGLTDEELVESILFDVRFQYALNLTSFEEIPYSDRTPSRFRERLYKHELETGKDLLKEEVERLSKEFAKMLKTNPSLKRMDSVMISSSCKDMSRLELLYTCTKNLIKAINATGETMLLSTNLMKYLDENNENLICYRTKDVTTHVAFTNRSKNV